MRPFFRSWILLPLAVVALVIWLQSLRLNRVQQLTALPQWSVDAPAPDRASPTGYAGGLRNLVVSDPTGRSQQWIAQTQQMLAEGTWQVRHVDYDNAPSGRETRLPSLYRGWLGSLARLYAAVTGDPAGVAVEHVALHADPLLQLLLVLLTTWFVYRRFGTFAALIVAVAIVTIYPFATAFLPGAPDSQGLAEAFALWSVLPLVAGLWLAANPHATATRRMRTGFASAALAAALGLSVSLNTQLTVLAGVALGALAAAWCARADANAFAPPWRLWGLSGCVASLAIYMLEHFPAHLSLRLDGNHPLYALGWLALGELLQRSTEWIQLRRLPRDRGTWLTGGAALLGLFAIGATAVALRANPFAADLSLSRLTRLGDGVAAENLLRWFAADGVHPRVWATLLPAVFLLAACIPLAFRIETGPRRAALALALGPAAVTFLLSLGMLRWWNTFDAVAIAALAVATASAPRTVLARPWAWALGTTVVAAFGLLQLIPPRTTFSQDEFTPAEMQALMERDLAHSLAQRRPDAVVLAPPNLTTSLWFYGGVRGIGSFDADNRVGFLGALRIAGAPSPQEAFALMERRAVTHIVVPSWDRSFDVAARENVNTGKSTFLEQLREWIVPLWLRPVAYYLPRVSGFEAKSVVLFEIVEEQDEPTLISQLATYFIEAGMPGHASELRKFMRPYASNLSALVSLAEIELLREDQTGFAAALQTVETALAGGADRYLPWDRRIALATVLARGNRDDLARAQLALCVERVSEDGLRRLSTRSLFRFLALSRNYGLAIEDPSLRELSLRLVPPESRARLR